MRERLKIKELIFDYLRFMQKGTLRQLYALILVTVEFRQQGISRQNTAGVFLNCY